MAVPYLVTVSLLVNKHFLNVCSGPDPVLVQAPGLPHPTPALSELLGSPIPPLPLCLFLGLLLSPDDRS